MILLSKDFSHILTECGYNDNIRPTTVYPLRFDDYLYGFAALELNEKAINFQQFKGTEIMLDLMCAVGREPFYHKHEFISRPTDKLGPGMIRYIRK